MKTREEKLQIIKRLMRERMSGAVPINDEMIQEARDRAKVESRKALEYMLSRLPLSTGKRYR